MKDNLNFKIVSSPAMGLYFQNPKCSENGKCLDKLVTYHDLRQERLALAVPNYQCPRFLQTQRWLEVLPLSMWEACGRYLATLWIFPCVYKVVSSWVFGPRSFWVRDSQRFPAVRTLWLVGCRWWRKTLGDICYSVGMFPQRPMCQRLVSAWTLLGGDKISGVWDLIRGSEVLEVCPWDPSPFLHLSTLPTSRR